MTPPNAGTSNFTLLHRNAIANFVDPERIGYVRDRDTVAGFESHRLSSFADENYVSKGRPDWLEGRPDWQIVRLELVSLLRHDEPRVYVAESMPSMDELAGVPHRALNEFERGALPQLVAQQDVVIGTGAQRIAMLGAVRAGATCLECHEERRGELLGAFSYELTPLPSTEKATAAADLSQLSR
jgi:hypothetical protein